MNKEIKLITLIFEDNEKTTFDKSVIGNFYIGKIKPCINRVSIASIQKLHRTKEVIMEVFSEGNTPFDNNIQIFDRIYQYNDILKIVLTYENEDTEEYIVDYDDTGDLPYHNSNKNQKTFISLPGNLYIVIRSGKDIDDYFDMTDINDAEIMKQIKEVYVN